MALHRLVFLLLSALAGMAHPATPCRLDGVEHEALCGEVARALDPAQPGGAQIQIHYAVLPALARNKQPDPVIFFAGGPGQSAIALAGPVSMLLQRVLNRRDVVLIDLRGSGRSAPLRCGPEDPWAPLAEAFDSARQRARLLTCRDTLRQLPHGDLRHYTTSIAVADVDAVRARLGAERVNLVGVSYGTRAALDYLRQFPQRVRRVVLDGVAPADMVLPASFSADHQAALDALFAACEQDPGCAQRHPQLRARWRAFVATLPREAAVLHPLSGRPERLTLTPELLVNLLRGPLYAPPLAAALPAAMEAAVAGRVEPLVGLALAFAGHGRARNELAQGLHFSVICGEDAPRLQRSTDTPGADFGSTIADLYRDVCADWPRGPVPAAFYQLPAASAATLVLSGGLDPVTPPRHGERVARALGAKARHVVVPNAGHGVLGIACMPDVVFRFIDAASDELALRADAGCTAAMPRPPMFLPLRGGAR